MFEHTESDILVRWHRMLGETTLWLPGTDHAGIATQMLVERLLVSESTSRQALGREAFVERVRQWRRYYGGAILASMKRIGDTVDWSREYYTMDDNLSVAVREAFVRLYEDGLIYRGAYIVNWCPRCQTAISDLEVTHEEQQGKLWEIRYPVVGAPGEFLTVATTRPETMLGDVAVAVNPLDERYTHLHGKTLKLPLTDVCSGQTARAGGGVSRAGAHHRVETRRRSREVRTGGRGLRGDQRLAGGRRGCYHGRVSGTRRSAHLGCGRGGAASDSCCS